MSVIDQFFESLRWDNTKETYEVFNVPYSKLLEEIDFKNRWVYMGSLTTPPCLTYVYWNIPRQVLPIN